MKIKDGFVLKEAAGSFLVVPLGSQVVDFCSIIKLSETGAFIWSKLESDTTVDAIVDALMSEYEVDKDKAYADVNKFIDKLKDANLLE